MTRKKFFAMLTAAPLALTGALFGSRDKTIAEWIPPELHCFPVEFPEFSVIGTVTMMEDAKVEFHGEHERCSECRQPPTLEIEVVEVGDFNPKTMELP